MLATAGHSLLTTSIGHICGHSSLPTGNYHTCGHSSLTTSVGRQTGAIDCSDVPKKQLKTLKRCMYLPKTHYITVFQSSRTRCPMDKHYTLRLKPQKSVKFQQTCICSHRAQTGNTTCSRKITRTKRYNEESRASRQKHPCHLSAETSLQLLRVASYAVQGHVHSPNKHTQNLRKYQNGNKYAQHHIHGQSDKHTGKGEDTCRIHSQQC